MNSITVTIPAQKFDERTYSGQANNGRCYLEDALFSMGIPAQVWEFGRTKINEEWYFPSKSTPFGCDILRRELPKGNSITIILEKRKQ